MSTGRSNAMDALPRASFLTYFRTPSQRERRTSEYCQRESKSGRANCSQAPLLPRIPEDAIAEEDTDEESRLGNCEYIDHCEDGEQNENEWEWSHVLSLIGYTLLVLLIVLNFNFLLYHTNAGLAKWDGRGSDVGSSVHEMHFCLAEQNRLAPTSRVWRYVPRSSDSYCRTKVLTIHADPTEEYKLFTEDIIVGKAAQDPLCNNLRAESKREPSASNTYIDADDDLAEEGVLSREA